MIVMPTLILLWVTGEEERGEMRRREDGEENGEGDRGAQGKR